LPVTTFANEGGVQVGPGGEVAVVDGFAPGVNVWGERGGVEER
jgi:hypothetical protein